MLREQKAQTELSASGVVFGQDINCSDINRVANKFCVASKFIGYLM